MSWPRRRGRSKDPENKSLMGYHLSSAINKVNQLQDKMVKHTVSVPFTPTELISWLFPVEVIKTLTEAKKYVEGHYEYGSYQQASGWSISISFAREHMLVPIHGALKPSPVEAAPLIELESQLDAIYRDFAFVTHVVEWIDANCTAGAAKYYFPSIMSLVKDCPALAGDGTTRFREPKGIAPMLPLIRDAAATVACALLLPEQDPPSQNLSLTLELAGHKVTHESGMIVEATSHSYEF